VAVAPPKPVVPRTSANAASGARAGGAGSSAVTQQRVVAPQGPGSGAPNKIDNLANGMMDWLGNDVRVITNPSGDKIFMSNDGLRKIRFDINNPSPHSNPHAHFEQLIGGRWRPVNPGSPQIYPSNVPHR